MNIDTDNFAFQAAMDLLTGSERSIFLTGKAGTGKTTFLRYIRDRIPRQMAVVAPTGVAAINAGGVTLHSFFQLPLCPFVPEGPGFASEREEFINGFELISRLKIQKEKQKILQQLELLVIDEVSMVRCDTLDAVDVVLRHVRQRQREPFGGVQVLFIGDMFQLPPVIRDDTWDRLRQYYASPYFFDSHAVREQQPVYIEFEKIYRQTEGRFINLLNQVRNNELDQTGLDLLASRYLPDFVRSDGDGYITLTTHNERAREINNGELGRNKQAAAIYDAVIEGEFPEGSFPADEHLQLKIGAQVMFIRNDAERERRYFNGKIGVVTLLEEDRIVVDCADGAERIEAAPEKWENVRYVLNPSTRKMEQQLLGSFTQFPLRLAWAITIHKSQGLTFERAVIDAGRSFASGQVYVALSRCTSLDGLVLQSRITPGAFFSDRRIVAFSKRKASSDELTAELEKAQRKFHEKSLVALFDFSAPVTGLSALEAYVSEHNGSFSANAPGFLQQISGLLISLLDVGDKFIKWLTYSFSKTAQLQDNEELSERLSKASAWFRPLLQHLQSVIRSSAVSTDSRLHAKEYNDSLREIFTALALKDKSLSVVQGIPPADLLQQVRNSFTLPPFAVNAYGGLSSTAVSRHPVLYQQLRRLRDQICSRRDLPLYLVAGTKSIEEMADRLPQTNDQLLQVSGFGEAKVKAYGEEFLGVIRSYCSDNGLESVPAEVVVKPQKVTQARKKTSTRIESLQLFRDGLSIEQIAGKRALTVPTIEAHLASCVSTGEVNVEELMPREKLLLIEAVLDRMGSTTLAVIREELDNAVGFGDIRIAMAWQEYRRSQP